MRSIPIERVHEQSRLLEPNEQCRLCLRAYQVDERVRRLPCQHRFHIDCSGNEENSFHIKCNFSLVWFDLDGWLLHSHPTCPIDGHIIWNAEGKNEKKETKR